MIASISLYTIIWIISYGLIYKRYYYVKKINTYRGVVGHKLLSCKQKMPIYFILIISMIFVLYNMYITQTSVSMGGDRLNYLANFTGARATSSAGLSIIIRLTKFFNGDINSLFYVTTFICMVITLIAYRLSKEATPNALLLLFFSQYIFSTFVNLKQSYSSAIATLLFVLILEYKSTFKMLHFFLIFVAILFHPSAFILIPIYIIINANKSSIKIVIFCITIFVFGILYTPLMESFAMLIDGVLPFLSSKILAYAGEGLGNFYELDSFAFIKGAPFYFITVLAFFKRKPFIKRIDNYDNYLIISCICSYVYMLSIYNVWMSRLIFFFLFSTFVIFEKIVSMMKNNRERWICRVLVYGSLFLLLYRYLAIIYMNYGGF